MKKYPKASLFLLGAACLYWELLLIRWLSAWVRIVAYYTNFVLIAAFFGLGLGALLTRFELKLSRTLAPMISICLLTALGLSTFLHLNPGSSHEYIWIGTPLGLPSALGPMSKFLSLPALLAILYVLVSCIFIIFGQWLGRLFTTLDPLKAYSTEILGSIFGILLFALLSYLGLSPTVWILLGFVMICALLCDEPRHALVAAVCGIVVLILVNHSVQTYLWSPYYKIKVEAITEVRDLQTRQPVHFDSPIGYQIEVNNDYHQMLLDLRPKTAEHPFITSWRRLYELPYAIDKQLPEGPILIIGAGTGNDVAAALRTTGRQVYAVDIDREIVKIGRRLHPENPYGNDRVHVVIDDARSFIQKTPVRFSMVVFGFLDSHTLFSAFSSLRLDNFVYTKECLQRVKHLLAPGGEVVVTFAVNQPWLHQRLLDLLTDVFDTRTQFIAPPPLSYANGIVYRNFKKPLPPNVLQGAPSAVSIKLATDNWPFLYLAEPRIPPHYYPFLFIVIGLALASLGALPRGQRTVNLPFFFMGAAFFLLETSNVVSLSLLFGSTWIVNVVVFLGILSLVLAGTWIASRRSFQLSYLFLALFGSLALVHAVPVSALLSLSSVVVRGLVASLIFLGPVFFASLIFARLLQSEGNLPQAYGSNLLGSVIGGVCEYLSLIFGFHFLLYVIALLYLFVFGFSRHSRQKAS